MNQYQLLIDSLRLMSLSYEDQVKVLPDFVSRNVDTMQDDIVSNFCDAFSLFPQLMETNTLPYLAVKKILYCFNLVELNISRTDIVYEDFKSSTPWEGVRQLAKEALEAMSEPCPPLPLASG